MKHSFYTLVILLFFTHSIHACSCAPFKLAEQQQREMQSECIFVGQVVEVNEDLTFEISVVESLDGGDVQGNVYIGQNWRYCYPYVENKGTWLFYGRIENGLFKVNSCGLSRSFSNPFTPISDSEEVKELMKKLEYKKLNEKESQDIIRKIQLIDMANEIHALRKKRDYGVTPNDV